MQIPCGHVHLIAYAERRLALGIEIVLSNPTSYFAHRKNAIGGMASFDKNKYRRRKIKLSPKMISALKNQKIIYDQFKGKYFFCNETGNLIDPSNLRTNVWIPTLKKAGLEYREMRQTRHSFGTYHLSKGTDPLKIAKVMGHRNAEMVIKVYGKYIDDGIAIED